MPQVKIHRFLEERKTKKVDKDKKNEESEAVIKEEEKLKNFWKVVMQELIF